MYVNTLYNKALNLYRINTFGSHAQLGCQSSHKVNTKYCDMPLRRHEKQKQIDTYTHTDISITIIPYLSLSL